MDHAETGRESRRFLQTVSCADWFVYVIWSFSVWNTADLLFCCPFRVERIIMIAILKKYMSDYMFNWRKKERTICMIMKCRVPMLRCYKTVHALDFLLVIVFMFLSFVILHDLVLDQVTYPNII